MTTRPDIFETGTASISRVRLQVFGRSGRGRMLRTFGMLAATCVMALGSVAANAQASNGYPNKPVRLVVGFSAGTAADLLARVIGERLTARWHQGVVVDNRIGASGTIASSYVAHAAPDGYTLYIGSSSLIVSPYFMAGVTYDVFTDFAPVIMMVSLPMVAITPPQLKLNSVGEFIALARSRPGALNFATAGKGSPGHISAEVLSMSAGIDMVEVPFKSTSDALLAVTRGDVAIYFTNIASAQPLLQQGTVKALAVSTAKRNSALPDLPSMAETIPGFDAQSFYGIVVPAHTPPDIIARINTDINAVLAEPDVKEKIRKLGGDIVGGGPEALGARMKVENDQAQAVVKRLAREGKADVK